MTRERRRRATSPARRGRARKRSAKRSPASRRWLLRTLTALGLALLLPGLLVLPWRWLPPPTSAFMLQDPGPVTQRWRALDEIASALPLAVLAAEDQRFPEHHGFDFEQIRRATLERGRLRGASTISQQVAKNLFLWPERSWTRKAIEAYFTCWIEALWPKRRILEIYVNVAEFGPGVYGAEAASWEFFQKPAIRLRGPEAALLAAALPNPKRRNVAAPSPGLRERARKIEGLVRSLDASVLARL